MMYSREQIEQHVWDYMDGSCTPAVKEMVEKLLHSDPAWKSVYLELKDFNTLVNTADMIESPSMRFSKNVMEEVAKHKIAPPTQAYINKKIVYGIAAFFVLTIVSAVIYGISQIDFSQTGNTTIPQMDFKKYEFDWTRYLNSPLMYMFLFLDVIGGLLLLDRWLRRNNEKLGKTA